jgi:hypothetical protein
MPRELTLNKEVIMKTTTMTLQALALPLAMMFLAMSGSVPAAYAQDTPADTHAFVDADGNGYNDNAPDADGDGIPNGMDSDFVRPGQGRGTSNGQDGLSGGMNNRGHANTGAVNGNAGRPRAHDTDRDHAVDTSRTPKKGQR